MGGSGYYSELLRGREDEVIYNASGVVVRSSLIDGFE